LPTKLGAVAPAVERERTTIEVPAAAQPAVAQALADLARRLSIDEATIEVLSVQPRSQPTGTSDSPGKPEGWLITLADATTSYRYQVDTRGRLQRLP
jgi:hypothetical protein